jgi:hypothetical protein
MPINFRYKRRFPLGRAEPVKNYGYARVHPPPIRAKKIGDLRGVLDRTFLARLVGAGRAVAPTGRGDPTPSTARDQVRKRTTCRNPCWHPAMAGAGCIQVAPGAQQGIVDRWVSGQDGAELTHTRSPPADGRCLYLLPGRGLRLAFRGRGVQSGPTRCESIPVRPRILLNVLANCIQRTLRWCCTVPRHPLI